MDYKLGSKFDYINEEKKRGVGKTIALIFVFCYFVLPQYFGIQLAGFDLTAQRISMLLMALYLLEDISRVKCFTTSIAKLKIINILFPYIFVLIYTSVIRVNVNTLMYSVIEFFCFFLIIYIVSDLIEINEFIRIIKTFVIILCVLGIVEFGLQRSLFSLLETIPGLYTGGLIRSGAYRVMGPSNHSLGYGLILITVFPLSCYDIYRDQVNLLANKMSFFLIAINIFLTGSRSTLAVFGLEIILIVFFSTKAVRRKTVFYVFMIIIFLGIYLLLFSNTFLGRYILRQFSSVIDEMFDTQYAVIFGADITTLYNSSNYRRLLLRIFSLDWLNPIVGRGSNYVLRMFVDGYYIKSIDNFYVAQYIRYAYPGLITYCGFVCALIYKMIKRIFQYNCSLTKILFISISCYFVNLWWLDTLQTIKYVYIIAAVFYVKYSKANMDS